MFPVGDDSVTVVVTSYGLAVVPDPVSDWLPGDAVKGVSPFRLTVVSVPPGWFAKSGPNNPPDTLSLFRNSEGAAVSGPAALE